MEIRTKALLTSLFRIYFLRFFTNCTLLSNKEIELFTNICVFTLESSHESFEFCYVLLAFFDITEEKTDEANKVPILFLFTTSA